MKQNSSYNNGPVMAGTILRLTMAAILFPHGSQLLLGWFGGFGFQGTMNYFTQVVGLPWIVGFLVILLQFFGAILLFTGLATRLVTIAVAFMFLGMIVTSHAEYGFFMNWSGQQAGEGYEYHILVIGMAIALLFTGPGSYSVDNYLVKAKLSTKN